jgi:cyclic pyranopterin phosphate synthase
MIALETIDLIGAARPAQAPLVDQFKRPITYLRISVTDRCNLGCVYCMSEAACRGSQSPRSLSFEEILRVVKTGAAPGLRSIRLTGGEPLVRRDLPGRCRKARAHGVRGELALEPDVGGSPGRTISATAFQGAVR